MRIAFTKWSAFADNEAGTLSGVSNFMNEDLVLYLHYLSCFAATTWNNLFINYFNPIKLLLFNHTGPINFLMFHVSLVYSDFVNPVHLLGSKDATLIEIVSNTSPLVGLPDSPDYAFIKNILENSDF